MSKTHRVEGRSQPSPLTSLAKSGDDVLNEQAPAQTGLEPVNLRLQG